MKRVYVEVHDGSDQSCSLAYVPLDILCGCDTVMVVLWFEWQPPRGGH